MLMVFTFSSRVEVAPPPLPDSRGCSSKTVLKSFSEVAVRKPISAFGWRPYRWGDSYENISVNTLLNGKFLLIILFCFTFLFKYIARRENPPGVGCCWYSCGSQHSPCWEVLQTCQGWWWIICHCWWREKSSTKVTLEPEEALHPTGRDAYTPPSTPDNFFAQLLPLSRQSDRTSEVIPWLPKHWH